MDIRDALANHPNDILGAVQCMMDGNPQWEDDPAMLALLSSYVTDKISEGAQPLSALRWLDGELTLGSGRHLLSRTYLRHLAAYSYNDYLVRTGNRTDLLRIMVDSGGTPIVDAVPCSPERHYESYETEVRSGGGALFGFGIPALDAAYGYLAPGEVLALVGAPGSFKTSLALSAVDDALKDEGRTVMFMSLDMPAEKITARRLMRELLCSEQSLSSMVRMDDPALAAARERLARRDAERLTIVGSRRDGPYSWKNVEEMAAQKGPDLLIIDYLTRIGNYSSELSCVRDLMPKVGKFASEFGIATILLSQMSRTSRADQRDKSGGHAAGGHYVEDAVDIEIELQLCRHDDKQDIVATVAKTRKCESGKSFFLMLKGAQLAFDSEARPAERTRRPVNIFEGKI